MLPIDEISADVLILGGGVIGLTAAYFLAREGLRIQVVDKGDFGQEASWAGAGILPPGNPLQARTPFDQLRAHSAALFPALSAELRERTGIDNGYLRCGGLEIAGPGEDITDEWRAEQISFSSLDEGELKRLQPVLNARGRGFTVYYLRDMAQVRSPRHIKALLAACAACRVSLRPGYPVHGFERRGARVTSLRADGARRSHAPQTVRRRYQTGVLVVVVVMGVELSGIRTNRGA